MGLWTFNVTHKNQTTAFGSQTIDPPGKGNPVTIRHLACSCNFSHTLVGTQTDTNRMSGSGANSVAPPNDPRAKPSIKADEEPRWEGSPGGPDPKSRKKTKPSTKKPGTKKPGTKKPSKKKSK